MRQNALIRTIGLTGAAFIAGYLFRAGSGTWVKNLTRGLRAAAESAGFAVAGPERNVAPVEEPKKATRARKPAGTARKSSTEDGGAAATRPKPRKSAPKRSAKA